MGVLIRFSFCVPGAQQAEEKNLSAGGRGGRDRHHPFYL